MPEVQRSLEQTVQICLWIMARTLILCGTCIFALFFLTDIIFCGVVAIDQNHNYAKPKLMIQVLNHLKED